MEQIIHTHAYKICYGQFGMVSCCVRPRVVWNSLIVPIINSLSYSHYSSEVNNHINWVHLDVVMIQFFVHSDAQFSGFDYRISRCEQRCL